jgi:5'-nucleotidase
MEDDERTALLDLDGTVADYDLVLAREMRRLESPQERPYDTRERKVPPYVEARRELIKSKPGFWRSLPRLDLGFDVVNCLTEVGFSIMVLTKGSETISLAWKEKYEWCQEHLPFAAVTVTQENGKSLVYGRVLVDDHPGFYIPWLAHRPRGLVIAVAQPWNEDASTLDPRIIRYDGTNLLRVREAILRAYSRS